MPRLVPPEKVRDSGRRFFRPLPQEHVRRARYDAPLNRGNMLGEILGLREMAARAAHLGVTIGDNHQRRALYVSQSIGCLVLLLGVVLGGRKSLWGAFLGAALVALLPNLLSNQILFQVFSGVGLALALLAAWRGLSRRTLRPFQALASVATTGSLVAGGLLVQNTEDWRKAIFALNRLAINLGMSVGPAAGGFLATRSFVALFAVDGTTTLLAGLILAMFGSAAPRQAHVEPSRSPLSGTPFPRSRPAHRDARLLLFLAAVGPARSIPRVGLKLPAIELKLMMLPPLDFILSATNFVLSA